jgi:uncharacterized membrane protein
MLWLRILVIVLAIAAIVCGGYDFHLHLHNCTRDKVMDVSMLTLFLGLTATALAALDSRLRRQ